MSNLTRQAECEILEGTLSKQRADREQLERQIIEIQAQLRQLDSAILSTKSRRAMLAPVNMLPDDVMFYILRIAYLHDFPHCRADDGLYHTNSPVAFSQVCRRWRGLALATPSLWTCIHVTPHQSEGYPEMARLYLVRSRNRAVSVTFQCHAETSKYSTSLNVSWARFAATSWPRYWESWQVLMAQSHRWKHCAVHSTFGVISLLISHTLQGCILPRLQYLAHTLPSHESHHGAIQFFAPNLRRMDLTHVYPGVPKTDVLKRLTELRLTVCLDILELLDLLRQTSALERLTLKGIDLYHHDWDWTTAPPIPLPRLRYLVLADYHEYGESVRSIASIIFRAAPYVEELVLSDADAVCKDLENLPPLRALRTLHYGQFSSEWCILSRTNVSSVFPNIEELDLTDDRAVNELDALRTLYESSEVVLLPHLRSLTLSAYAHRVNNMLCAFIEHRAQIGYPIQAIELSVKAQRSLSPHTRTLFVEHSVKLVLRAHGGLDDAGEVVSDDNDGDDVLVGDWLDYDWNLQKNAPVYIPWDGSLDWWDQF